MGKVNNTNLILEFWVIFSISSDTLQLLEGLQESWNVNMLEPLETQFGLVLKGWDTRDRLCTSRLCTAKDFGCKTYTWFILGEVKKIKNKKK